MALLRSQKGYMTTTRKVEKFGKGLKSRVRPYTCRHAWKEVRQVFKGDEIRLSLICGECKTRIVEIYKIFKTFKERGV